MSATKRTDVKAKRMSSAKILALPMARNDAGAKTIRDYLKALIEGVWDLEERFSGKRPFGNGGWKYDLYDALAAGRAVAAVVHEFKDEDGNICREIECADRLRADQLITKAIKSL
jgi:hypothetical protein